MNIKVTHSAGFAFDLLSINAVKLDRVGGKANEHNFENLVEEIRFQIGRKKFEEIVKSEEYIKLYDVNAEIFDLVDYLKDHPLDASVVDSKNYERFQLKNKLQEKFFGGQTSEVKAGY